MDDDGHIDDFLDKYEKSPWINIHQFEQDGEVRLDNNSTDGYYITGTIKSLEGVEKICIKSISGLTEAKEFDLTGEHFNDATSETGDPWIHNDIIIENSSFDIVKLPKFTIVSSLTLENNNINELEYYTKCNQYGATCTYISNNDLQKITLGGMAGSLIIEENNLKELILDDYQIAKIRVASTSLEEVDLSSVKLFDDWWGVYNTLDFRECTGLKNVILPEKDGANFLYEILLPNGAESVIVKNDTLENALINDTWYRKLIDGEMYYSNHEDVFGSDRLDVYWDGKEKQVFVIKTSNNTKFYGPDGQLLDTILNSDDEAIALNESCIQLATKDKFELISNKSSVIWTSSNENVAVVDENGIVTALRYGNATITATSPNGTACASCDVKVLFYDVAGSSSKYDENYQYYYSPVYWAAAAGITKGYDNVYFGVGESCTRAAVAIFLWRMEGCPQPKNNAKKYFNDITGYGPGSDTNKAIAWAYEAGIVKGNADGSFGVKNSITRADVLIMLYRYAGKPSVTGTIDFTDCKSYTKGSDTYKAILWGAKKGITKGYEEGDFRPKENCLREQIITFMYRYNKLKK